MQLLFSSATNINNSPQYGDNATNYAAQSGNVIDDSTARNAFFLHNKFNLMHKKYIRFVLSSTIIRKDRDNFQVLPDRSRR